MIVYKFVCIGFYFSFLLQFPRPGSMERKAWMRRVQCKKPKHRYTKHTPDWYKKKFCVLNVLLGFLFACLGYFFKIFLFVRLFVLFWSGLVFVVDFVCLFVFVDVVVCWFWGVFFETVCRENWEQILAWLYQKLLAQRIPGKCKMSSCWALGQRLQYK